MTFLNTISNTPIPPHSTSLDHIPKTPTYAVSQVPEPHTTPVPPTTSNTNGPPSSAQN